MYGYCIYIQNLMHDRLIISLPNELINIFSKFQENLAISSTLSVVL